MKKPALLGKRRWTANEETYLADRWGTLSIPTIAKKLNRTVNAVKIRAQRLSLGAVLMGGEYVSLNQLIIAVTGSETSYSYKIKSWIENRGLPVHTKKVVKNAFRVVYLNEFWKWAEKNKAFIDFSKMQPLSLGAEPKWVAEQRRKDFQALALQRKDPWTPEEDDRLIYLLNQHKYGYAEISAELYRSDGAIQRRCTDLGLKERPVKADSHTGWTDADYQAVADGIRTGDSYAAIGITIGRSEKAIRGKVYYTYLTENADKIRTMMGDGQYGAGASEPTVKQGIHLSRCRKNVRESVLRLVTALRFRRNELGYEPYWQRHMCVKWHDIKGCTVGCDNCDECTKFERIKPQYCVRCGATFYERTSTRICSPCRTARKKAAQRKYVKLNAKTR